MTDDVIGLGFSDRVLTDAETEDVVSRSLDAAALYNQRVLVIIPDGTRTAPIPLFFRLVGEYLRGRVGALDYLVALGTHTLMSDDALLRHVGVRADELATLYPGVGIYNHRWDLSETFVSVGSLPADETARLSGGRVAVDVDVRINRMVLEYDVIIIVGPVFPHEVVGFSGGNKYFFPGIGGAEVINFTHWLGALITNREVIGAGYTPVRAVIDRAASLVQRRKLCFSLVVSDRGLHGVYVGSPEASWREASRLSARVHVRYFDRPFERVLALIPEMYPDMWTGAKGMYKTEPVLADGGEVVLHAPHVERTSYVHGHHLDDIGYHVRDYFLAQWDRFKQVPWGVLAHSTHVRGSGTYEEGREWPRVQVTFATQIPQELCSRLNVGYRAPGSIRLEEWKDREDDGFLVVPHAGQVLYRLRAPDELETTEPG